MTQLTTSHKIKLWEAKPRTGSRTGWRVRWMVAGREHNVTLPEEAAKSFHASLEAAWKTHGEAFDIVSGLPVSMALAELQKVQQERAAVTCIAAMTEYIDTKWEEASGHHRRNLAEVLMWAAIALLPSAHSQHQAVAARRALRTRQFNPVRRDGASTEDQRWMAWAQKHSPSVEYLADLANVRNVLADMQRQFNGKPRSANCKRRARSALNGFLEYAAEQQYVSTNQVASIRRGKKSSSGAIDRRRCANGEQKDALIENVRGLTNGWRYAPYFGLQAYGGLRPEEAIDVRAEDLELPGGIRGAKLDELTPAQMECWSRLHVHETASVVGSMWTDSGEVRDDRGLKMRERGEVRVIDCEPKLTKLLIKHQLHPNWVPGPQGQLCTGPGGGPLADSTCRRKFHEARNAMLTPAQQATVLLKRQYDLRHSCISEWLADVGDPTIVAEWAGHSVAVLLRVYAKCIDGRQEVAKRRIMEARYRRKLELVA